MMARSCTLFMLVVVLCTLGAARGSTSIENMFLRNRRAGDVGQNPCVSGGEQCCAGTCAGACSQCVTCHLPCTHCKTCCNSTCDCSPFCLPAPSAPLNKSIPNVLLIGDSISGVGTGYLTNVQAMLGPSASTVTGGGAVGNAAVQDGPGYF